MPRAESRQTHGDPHAQLKLHAEGVPPEDATGAVVLLHGRGRTARGILSLAAPMAVPGTAYLAPQAAGRTWYPRSFLAPVDDNEPGLSSALRALDRIVATLRTAGLVPENIVFVGFSQGACLAAEYLARRPRRYGGAAILIGGLFGPEGPPLDYTGSLADTPVFLSTSDPDPFVPPSRVRETAEVLSGMGARVTLRVQENAGHVITQEGLAGALGLVKDLKRVPTTQPASASSFGATAPPRRRIRERGRPTQSPPTAL